MLLQMQVQLDYEDDKEPSLMSVLPASRYHTDSDFLGKDSKMPVWYQRIHSRESHLYLLFQQVYQKWEPKGFQDSNFSLKNQLQ